MSNNAISFYKEHGFSLVNMGGNITAFVKDVPEIGMQVVIQEWGDTGIAPKEVGMMVWVSLSTPGGEELLAFKAAHGQAAMQMLEQGEAWGRV